MGPSHVGHGEVGGHVDVGDYVGRQEVAMVLDLLAVGREIVNAAQHFKGAVQVVVEGRIVFLSIGKDVADGVDLPPEAFADIVVQGSDTEVLRDGAAQA